MIDMYVEFDACSILYMDHMPICVNYSSTPVPEQYSMRQHSSSWTEFITLSNALVSGLRSRLLQHTVPTVYYCIAMAPVPSSTASWPPYDDGLTYYLVSAAILLNVWPTAVQVYTAATTVLHTVLNDVRSQRRADHRRGRVVTFISTSLLLLPVDMRVK